MNEVHDQGRLGRLDLNLFRVFDVIYRERNLTRAAAVLCLSQSAVSHALGRLRKQLEDPLFVRDGQGVAPTALAERLAPDIRRAVGLLQQALHRRDFQPARDLLRVTVAMHDEIEAALLPPMLARFRAGAPQLQVASVRLERASLKTDLASGRLDLAVDVAQPTEAELHHQLLLRDDFCVISGRPGPLAAADYLAARHIAVSSRRSGPTVEDLLLSRLGLQRRIGLRCQHYEAACRIVADSELLLTMPRRHAGALAAEGVFLAPVPVPLPPLELHLYWHRQAASDPANRWVRDQLLELVRELD